jgi:hypothetical protein
MRGDALENRAEEICAHLLIFPYLQRDKFKDLLLDDHLRDEVARRLDRVGMRLAESFYSDHFAVKPKESIEADIRFDWASNRRLPRGAVALLVVLWARLVMPRRIARDQRMNPDEPADLFPEQKRAKDYVVKVPKEALLAEYGDRFGRSNMLRYMGLLKRLGFVREDRSGRLFEGPLLDLLIDGQKLATEIQAGVLRDLLGQEPKVEAGPELELVPESSPDLPPSAVLDDDPDADDEVGDVTDDDFDDDEPLLADLTALEPFVPKITPIGSVKKPRPPSES